MKDREKDYLEKQLNAFLAELKERFGFESVAMTLQYVECDGNGEEWNLKKE